MFLFSFLCFYKIRFIYNYKIIIKSNIYITFINFISEIIIEQNFIKKSEKFMFELINGFKKSKK